METKILYILLATSLITGCVTTRDPQLEPMSRSGDTDLNCEQIYIEYASNTQIAGSKIKKNNNDDIQDVMLGILIWPGLADFKNADGIEGNALLDRNIYLQNIAVVKNCNLASHPKQPERYGEMQDASKKTQDHQLVP